MNDMDQAQRYLVTRKPSVYLVAATNACYQRSLCVCPFAGCNSCFHFPLTNVQYVVIWVRRREECIICMVVQKWLWLCLATNPTNQRGFRLTENCGLVTGHIVFGLELSWYRWYLSSSPWTQPWSQKEFLICFWLALCSFLICWWGTTILWTVHPFPWLMIWWSLTQNDSMHWIRNCRNCDQANSRGDVWRTSAACYPTSTIYKSFNQ